MQTLELQNSLFEEETTWFADVIVPVSVPNLYTYRLMREHVSSLQIGARVIVQFGATKVLTGVVYNLHQKPPQKYQAKYILEILDENPFLQKIHLDLYQWISEYYMCNIGDVLNNALPSGLKISSLSKIQTNPDFEAAEILTEREILLLALIAQHKSLTFDELGRFADVKNPYHIVKALVEKKAIIVFEEVKEKYSPKSVQKIRLSSFYTAPENLKALISVLENGKKISQISVIMKYLSFVPVLKSAELNAKGLEKSIFNKDDSISASALATLIKNEIFETFSVVVGRFSDIDENRIDKIPKLSDDQERAYSEILNSFKEKDTVLLHGITGSGKTEVFIKLVQQALESGTQALYLLPEIALTTQILQRMKVVFGEKVGIYHSKFSDNERVEVYMGIAQGKYQFVIGVRSAIFLPFDNLGLIIVDEEHESSYKQFDPAPRYHARDVAMVLGKRHKAKVLLGSATPSIESTYHAKTGKFGWVEMKHRFGNAQLPDIELINTKLAIKQKTVKGEYTEELLQIIGENLAKKQQTLLFQNRRGYSPYLQCEDCSWVGLCYQCDVSLTYHYKGQDLRCHYCGHHEIIPKSCPACGGFKLKNKGFGTEKVEEDMQLMFPDARIARMDLDTTQSKTAFQTMIQDVENGDIDMLVGTQMVSKGLDFEKVSVVAIFDADRMIHYPDFRAAEKAFQLLTQVAGRAGRRATKGKVLIQTNNPDNALLQKIVANDYEGMYAHEIEEREKYHYPPFSRLIHITLKHQNQDICFKAAETLCGLLGEQLGKTRVLGPEKPVIDRIRDKFIYEILIKFERNTNLKAIKEYISAQILNVYGMKEFKNIYQIVDVDYVG